jgi:prophage regulatory protein
MNKNIVKLTEVMNMTTFSRSTVYRLISQDKFPKQVKLSERSSGWIEQEVLDYLDACINNRS